ncbi:sigma-70 family RNA polymerase sigma factor [Streptoalloteichus hindustanus]|uniref:RNA polymerase sigma factor n=1 Tax=Streptoalloteichus hindustanus TaxID=2017 RepID=A0A1M5MX49_STRHI|nr:sigma-70 family RNA polymerase sigma factor [Streptoalloteichus hindustanus]SHG81920.1 RNA polymerase sigma-70 factor, ECF subfamily [Streptoalloteichus hindustanus]
MSGSSEDDITGWAMAARRGDRAALERFVRATQQDVWRFAAHLTDSQLAEDLAQETYVRALGSIGRFEGRSSARTWLLSIARRVAADHIRAVRVRPRQADVPDWQQAAEQARSGAGTRFEEYVALRELVDALDPERREAFFLTQALGLSYAEAAEVCDCPIGTIRSRVARAREELISSLGSSPNWDDRPGGRRLAM